MDSGKNVSRLRTWSMSVFFVRILQCDPSPVLRMHAVGEIWHAFSQHRTFAHCVAAQGLPQCLSSWSVVQGEHTINSMAVSDDVRWLAAGTASSCIHLYDLQKLPHAQSAENASQPWEAKLDEGDCVKYLWGHSGPVYGLSFTCDKRLLYSCGCDGTVRMWVTEMGANVFVWRSHMLPVWDVEACPRGHWLVSGGADWVVSLWCAPPSAAPHRTLQ